MRSLLFAIWIKSSKDADTALALVESMAAGEYDMLTQGGARIVSANVAGKQFQYELPQGWSSTDFIENLRLIYTLLLSGGTSGAAMTDAQVEAYVRDTGCQVTNVAKARFAQYAGGRI